MTVGRFYRATRIAILLCVCIIVTIGCNGVPPPAQRADYSATLNRYYDGRPMCLWPDSVKFPTEDVTPAQIDERGFNALAGAGLLVRQRPGKSAPKGSYTFDLTPEGRSAFNRDIFNPGAGNFCYGRRKVISIDDDRHNSQTTELINFRYSVTQPASWATEYSVQRAFPQIISELSGPHKAEATLLDTTEGWEVSGTPAIIAPPTAAPPPSTVAKAKSLLHFKKKQAS